MISRSRRHIKAPARKGTGSPFSRGAFFTILKRNTGKNFAFRISFCDIRKHAVSICRTGRDGHAFARQEFLPDYPFRVFQGSDREYF